MQIDLPTVAAVAVPIVSVMVWLIRLEGRITVSETRHDDIIDRLDRIENKLDQR